MMVSRTSVSGLAQPNAARPRMPYIFKEVFDDRIKELATHLAEAE